MIPKPFLDRMQRLLGAEYPRFLSALEAPAERAVRVNLCKTDAAGFLSAFPHSLRPLSYASDGFLCDFDDKVGNHPTHKAGMFYVQDPGAMATVNAVDLRPGWRVLDVCAAPGGKSGQLSARIGENGVLVSNEINAARCRAMLGNAERLGQRNTAITNTDAKTLADWFDGWFDLALVDAPCSGEGMFRKYDHAAAEWSEENVLLCARRQGEILDHIASTVRPGGYLLYSTCTFSVEENEQTVAAFLNRHEEYRLCPVAEAVAAITSPGISVEGRDLSHARRFYPHKAPGEGQFLALLQKCEDAPCGRGVCYRDAAKTPDKATQELARAFLDDVLAMSPSGALAVVNDRLLLPPAGLPLPPAHLFAAGVTVGSAVKGRIEPHHQFFSAYGHLFRRQLCFAADAPQVAAYLRGETFSCPDAPNGWSVLMVEGCALGGVKVVAGVAKNHYPKGLRL